MARRNRTQEIEEVKVDTREAVPQPKPFRFKELPRPKKLEGIPNRKG